MYVGDQDNTDQGCKRTTGLAAASWSLVEAHCDRSRSALGKVVGAEGGVQWRRWVDLQEDLDEGRDDGDTALGLS